MISPISSERDFVQARLLMEEYSFDLAGFEAGELVTIWHERLDAELSWIRSAVLEALYLGRYKAFSVEQILQGWKRRGHPVRHFNSEFERIVFGPIDPVVSKYAAVTSLKPSELMLPQSESHSKGAEVAASREESPSVTPPAADALEQTREANNPLAEETEDEAQSPTTDMEPQQQELFSQPEPIQKFRPVSESSEFYQRLQSVAQRSE